MMVSPSAGRPKLLAYYFPDYHQDARNAAWLGDGWTEWELLRAARPRFPGHQQPRIPLRGEEDEADPQVMAEHIRLAKDHGIDGFIFDYYWYEDGPYLNRALDDGFLHAEGNEELEFSLMWANHDLLDIFPSGAPDVAPPLLKSGAVGREAFERFGRQLIAHYFSRPNHTRIDGRPRFSIYEIGQFVSALGGVDGARDALRWLDAETRAAGHPGVHLDAVIWGFSVLPSEVEVTDPDSLLRTLGFASASSYVWVHHIDLAAAPFPVGGEWSEVGDAAFRAYESYTETLSVPFHPNVTTGWDTGPRTRGDRAFEHGDYPWLAVWEPSLDAFRHGLEVARDFCERHPLEYREVTINAWNEWTEGSYLLPDTVRGYAYLEAIREVFGRG